MPVVTANADRCKRVKGLKVENWLGSAAIAAMIVARMERSEIRDRPRNQLTQRTEAE